MLARLAGAIAKDRFTDQPPLWYVDFGLDYDCNLNCRHCYAQALRDDSRAKMTLADYRRVAGECMELGAINFSFEGGEPFCYDGLFDVINACSPSRNIISITTNGTLLTPEKAFEIKSRGVDILTFSIDSADAKDHDAFRGIDGAHAKTMTGVGCALDAGIRVLVNTVVTHQSLRTRGVTDLLKWAEKTGVLIYLLMPAPAGRWLGKSDMLLNEDDQKYLMELVDGSPNVRTDLHANAGRFGCGAVKKNLYITPYGDVLPCPFMHISLGNVLRESMNEIRRKALNIPCFAGYHGKCLISNDADFIDKHLSKTFDAAQLPISCEDAFGQEDKS